MIPDWTLAVLLPAAMTAGVFTGLWLRRAGYESGFADRIKEGVRCAELTAEPELEAEPTEQETMDFLAAVRDDEPGEITGPFVITDADPPRAPRLTAAQRRRAVKKGRIPRTPGASPEGKGAKDEGRAFGGLNNAHTDLPGQGPLRPLRPRNGGLGETLGGPLAGELHHEPPTLERLEAVGTLADEIAATRWLRWRLECDAYRDEMAALGMFEGMASGWADLLAGFDAIEIPRLALEAA